MRSSPLLAAAALFTLGAFCVPAARSAPAKALHTYIVHDLEPTDLTEVTGLNASHDLCGGIEIELSGDDFLEHAAAMIGGHVIDLGTLGGDESFAYALNDKGQVVGEAQVASGRWHAFLWSDANGDGAANPGEMKDLGAADGRGSHAFDINNQGAVCGEIEYPNFDSRAFRWAKGKLQILNYPGGSRGAANWIGNDNTVLGDVLLQRRFQPMEWHSRGIGRPIRFSGPRFLSYTPVGKSRGGDLWINASGLSLLFGGVSEPCVKKPSKSRLIHLPFNGGSAFITSVNNAGQAVGVDEVLDIDEDGNPTSDPSGVYWQGRSEYDLDDLLAPGSNATMLDADAINEAGWIVGEALIGDEEHLVLLEPQ